MYFRLLPLVYLREHCAASARHLGIYHITSLQSTTSQDLPAFLYSAGAMTIVISDTIIIRFIRYSSE